MGRKNSSGFTLIEIVVVMAIIAALTGGITILAFRTISATREQTTREELKTIKRGIIGEATKMTYGEEFTFGFVGDVGNVPATLSELKTRGILPAFSFDSSKRMGAGWNGPYMHEQAGNFMEDPYGTAYIYSTAPYTNSDLGVPVLAKITSAGPDTMEGTSDDISIEILEPEVRSDLVGLVKDSIGLGIPNVDVEIYYPANGTLAMASTQADSEGVYQYADIPIGDRAVLIKPGILYDPESAFALGNQRNDVEFMITNFSENIITITSLTAAFTSDPPAYISEILVDDVSVFNVSGQQTRPGSGNIASFQTSASLSASTTAGIPNLRRLQVQRVEVPDIKMNKQWAGGSRKVTLKGFVDAPSGGGQTVDMAGVPFEISFSDGSAVAFAPRIRNR